MDSNDECGLYNFESAPKDFDQVDRDYIGAPLEITNRIRAKRASAGLKAYWGNQGAEEPETVAKDFLTDLFHWSEGQGIDLEDLLSRARGMYDEEKRAVAPDEGGAD